MKKTNLKAILHQTNTSIFIALAALTLVFVSCSKDDDKETSVEISEEMAANVIISAASPEAGGSMAAALKGIAIIEGEPAANKTAPQAKAGTYECGVQYDSSFNVSDESEHYVFNMQYAWNWTVYCNEMNMPDNATLGMNGSGKIAGPNVSMEIATEIAMSVDGLEESSDNYLVDYDFNMAGDYEFVSEDNVYGFTSTVSFLTDDLVIAKADHTISSGSLAISFKGTSNGATYNFTGIIEFTGNHTGKLTMESGNTYQLSW